MTSKERITAAFNHKNVDRTPIFEYILSGSIPSILLGKKYFNYETENGGWDKRLQENGHTEVLREYVKNRVELSKLLGHDIMYVVPNPVLQDKNKIYEIDNNDFIEDDPVIKIKSRNLIRQKLLDYKQTNLEESFLVYEYINKELQSRNMEIDLFAPAYFHGVWTDTDLMQAMLLDDEAVHEHFEICTRMCISRINELNEYGVRIIGIGGDFAGNKPLISAECYKKFILPEIKKCAEYAHKLGMWAVNTSDGALWYVIDDFLINSDVDAYMEIDMGAGMDLGELKSRFGDRITFMGNMDCGNVLSFMSCDEIRKMTIKCIEDGWGSGGHVFTASNAIIDSVPFENYLAMINAYKNYFSL